MSDIDLRLKIADSLIKSISDSEINLSQNGKDPNYNQLIHQKVEHLLQGFLKLNNNSLISYTADLLINEVLEHSKIESHQNTPCLSLQQIQEIRDRSDKAYQIVFERNLSQALSCSQRNTEQKNTEQLPINPYEKI